jgi:hypothetical protein
MNRELRESIEAMSRQLMRERGLRWMQARAEADAAHRCGAKTRTGAPCKRRPVPGKKRCGNHGALRPDLARDPRGRWLKSADSPNTCTTNEAQP